MYPIAETKKQQRTKRGWLKPPRTIFEEYAQFMENKKEKNK